MKNHVFPSILSSGCLFMIIKLTSEFGLGLFSGMLRDSLRWVGGLLFSLWGLLTYMEQKHKVLEGTVVGTSVLFSSHSCLELILIWKLIMRFHETNMYYFLAFWNLQVAWKVKNEFWKEENNQPAMVWMNMDPSKICVLELNPQGDSIKRRDPLEVVRSWGLFPHGWDSSPYKRGFRDLPFTPFTPSVMWGHLDSAICKKQGFQTLNLLVFHLWLPSLQNCWK